MSLAINGLVMFFLSKLRQKIDNIKEAAEELIGVKLEAGLELV